MTPPPATPDLLHTFETSLVSLPASEVMVMLGLLTIFMLFRCNRIGLVVAYLFAYRWGWLFFQQSFGAQFRDYVMGYYVFGAVVFLLVVIGMFGPPSSSRE